MCFGFQKMLTCLCLGSIFIFPCFVVYLCSTRFCFSSSGRYVCRSHSYCCFILFLLCKDLYSIRIFFSSSVRYFGCSHPYCCFILFLLWKDSDIFQQPFFVVFLSHHGNIQLNNLRTFFISEKHLNKKRNNLAIFVAYVILLQNI